MGSDNDKSEKLTIGRLARAAGVGVPTVRYYQRRGLLREPPKPATGRFRSYSENDLAQLLFIKHSKELGFTLAEISRLMEHAEEENCQAVRSLAQEKLRTVKSQIRLLTTRKTALKSMLKECSSDCSGRCSLYKTLNRAGR